MASPSLNPSRFNVTLQTLDMGRPNLFCVIFGNQVNGQTDSTNALSDALSAAAPYAEWASDIIAQNSETYSRVLGAYTPSYVRGIMGSDSYNSLLGIEDQITMKDLALMACRVQIPGHNFDMKEQKDRRDGNGSLFTISNRTHDVCQMTFYIDAQHRERYFFENWSNQMYDETNTQVYFPSLYERDVEIYTYDRRGVSQTVTTLHKAIPVRIGSVQMDFDNNNEVLKLDVDIQYRYMTSKIVPEKDRNTADIRGMAASYIGRGRNIINSF